MVLIPIQSELMQTMVVKKNRLKNRKNQKGMSVLESVPMIFVFTALVSSVLGFYGVTQKSILHSIASRSYGFEQIRHRPNITYLRDVKDGDQNSYHITNLRYFTVREPGSGATFITAKMNVSYLNRGPGSQPGNPTDHNTTAYSDISRQKINDKHYFESVWIKVGHGICLTADCGE